VPASRPVRLALAVALTGALLAACSSSAPTAVGASGATSATTPGSPASSAAASSPAATRASATPSRSPSARPTPRPTPSAAKSAAARITKPAPAPTGSRPGHARYAFPVRCSTAISYGHSHHDYPATDIFAAVGCTVVAPVDGRVDEVSTVDRWNPSTNLGATRGGLSFSIIGVDGVRYYGSHLSVLLTSIRPGVQVRAGQVIGKVGHSGDARYVASHLHFGISWPTGPGVWWVRRGEVYPWPYLDAWRAGIMRSPAAAVAAKHRQVGDGGCTVDC
jgi:murein DD-endopeptidase MepM/ murein hydrolase activator NlpD